MNEFIEQFLIESRELVQQATDDLLTLEGRPGDAERLDNAFRAFHTLKGAAGIVDFDAMGRALHAAEDVLSSVRAGSEPVTPELIGDGLNCLDQVLQWLDAMQGDGELPKGAEEEADAVVRRFQRTGTVVADLIAITPNLDWRDALLARHPAVKASTAIRFAPGADAFLRGEDPLARLAVTPGLLALEMEGGEPWPALSEMDPFRCQLVFLALFDGAIAEVRKAWSAVADQVEIVEVAKARTGDLDLSPAAEALIEAQQRLLEGADPEGLAGRMGSAGRVVANVLRRSGRADTASGLERALTRMVSSGDVAGLSEAIRQAVEGRAAPTEAAAPDIREHSPAEAGARTLRVEVERIDALVSLTGELIVAQNALGHASAQAQTGVDRGALSTMLKDQHAVLQRLVTELQRLVVNIRVLQMRYVFQRFPRLIREMVVTLGKPAHLVTEGDDTEADKVIVESLFEPLLHVLRNALDHGVESAEVRVAAGKPAAATIVLRALRQNDNVIVEVEDDGGGVDVDRVRAVAARRGLVSLEALAAMPDAEIVDLIFAPGFSTAAQVTSISGRGVGMDAVRSAVERLGGRVSLESRAGKGTLVRFTLPFAVMMSRVLTVELGSQLFGIPLDTVQETLRVARRDIKPIGAAQAFVLRNRTVPLIDLGQALGGSFESERSDVANVVVISAGGHLGGLEVDRLGERLDVMLKPLDGLLTGMAGVAGATLLGDGKVLLVLDVQALLQ